MDDNGTQDFSDDQAQVLRVVGGLASGVSFVASSVILIACLRFPRQETKLLVWLSFADILSNTASVLALGTTPEHDSACKVAGFMLTLAELAPVLWTGCISTSVYLTVFGTCGNTSKDMLTWAYVAFCFGVPLLVAVAAGVAGAYGDSGFGYCWIADKTERLIYFYIPLWIVIVYNTVVYFRVTVEYQRAMRQLHGSLGSSASTSRSHRLKYYPMVLIASWFFGTLNRIVQAATGNSYFGLALLHFTFGKLHGAFNAVVYGLDPTRELYATICPCLQAGAGGVDLPDEDACYGAGDSTGQLNIELAQREGSRAGQQVAPSPFVEVDF